MKRFSWKKLMSLVVALALVVGVLHFGTRVSAEEQTPSATATGDYAEGSEYGDLTPSLEYTINHTPATVETNVDLILAIDVSTSMVKNKYPDGSTRVNNTSADNIRYFADGTGRNASVYDKQASRIPVAANAAKNFVAALGDNVNVTVIGFKDSVITPVGDTAIDQIDYLANYANAMGSGTNIPAAVNDAISSLQNSQNKKILVIASDGEPYVNGSSATSTTHTALQNADRAGIDVYAIGLATNVNAFGADYVDKYATANSSSELNTALADIAGAVNKYADAKIVATLGNYVTYIGSDASVSVSEDGKTLTWDAPAHPTGFVGNVQTSPAIDFAVTIGGLTANDSMADADKEAIIRALIDKAEKDDEITVSTNEDGTIVIEVKVTAEANLYYTFDDNEEGPINVEVQSTATIFAGQAPVDSYDVLYYVDDEYIVDQNDLIEWPHGSVPTTSDVDAKAVSALGDYDDDKFGDPEIIAYTDNNYFEVRYTSIKTSTVTFIDEFQKITVDGEETEIISQETKTVGSAIEFPERHSYPVEGGRYDFDGWAIKYADSAVNVDADGIEAGTDVVEGYKLISANDYPAYTDSDITFYAQYHFVADYTVKFLNNDGSLVGKEITGPADTTKVTVPENPTFANPAANTTYTFIGWAKENTEEIVSVVEYIPVGGMTYVAIYKSTYTPPYTPSDPTPSPYIPPIIIVTPTPSPVPTEVPTEAPTPVPTQVPTEEPTPTPEPVVEVEEPETPEGDVEIDEIETPEGAPEEEELDVEPIDTPQGDLPKTGVLPTYAFIGIGAACVLFGSILVIKRRKEEN